APHVTPGASSCLLLAAPRDGVPLSSQCERGRPGPNAQKRETKCRPSPSSRMIPGSHPVRANPGATHALSRRRGPPRAGEEGVFVGGKTMGRRKSSAPGGPVLRLVRLPGEHGPVLRCRGHLTVATAEALRRELEFLLPMGHDTLTVNLTGCREVDVYGLL